MDHTKCFGTARCGGGGLGGNYFGAFKENLKMGFPSLISHSLLFLSLGLAMPIRLYRLDPKFHQDGGKRTWEKLCYHK